MKANGNSFREIIYFNFNVLINMSRNICTSINCDKINLKCKIKLKYSSEMHSYRFESCFLK